MAGKQGRGADHPSDRRASCRQQDRPSLSTGCLCPFQVQRPPAAAGRTRRETGRKIEDTVPVGDVNPPVTKPTLACGGSCTPAAAILPPPAPVDLARSPRPPPVRSGPAGWAGWVLRMGSRGPVGSGALAIRFSRHSSMRRVLLDENGICHCEELTQQQGAESSPAGGRAVTDNTEGVNAEVDAGEDEVSEAHIAVHWREEEYIEPPAGLAAEANAGDPAIFERFAEDKFPECFTEYADLLTWDERWHTTLDSSTPPFWKWFVGGKLNASYNCVDRHAQANPDKTAIIWVPELESDAHEHISYAELLRRVNEFAAVLRDFAGLKAGDRVTLHMPMVPDLPVTMLACARLGVIHSQVFGGFSGNACGTRIADSGSRVLITMDGYYRAGQLIDHKVKADEALDEAARQGQEVDKVLVWRRHAGQYASATPMAAGRDFFVDEVLG